MATAAPSPAASAEPLRGRARIRLTTRAAVLFVLVLTVLALAVAPLRAFMDQRARIARLETLANALERENLELRLRIVRLQGPAELERIARECLGYVQPGEVPVIPIPEDGSGTPPDC
jgi:cell division protein FtsB